MIRELREFWRTRHDKPELIPDPVTRIFNVTRERVATIGIDQVLASYEADGWTVIGWEFDPNAPWMRTGDVQVTVRRFDGAVGDATYRRGY
jgi:hypothetical protein